MLISLRIAAQHTKEIRYFLQMAESFLRDRVVDVTEEIQVEQILPRFAAQGAGFDLGQIEVAQGERAQGAKQRSWNIARSEHQRCLPFGTGICSYGKFARKFRTPEQEKTRKIPPVVFNGTLENSGPIICGRQRRGDSGRVGELLFHNHLHTAGGIVERYSFDARMIGEEIQALVESHRVGENTANFAKRHARRRDQIMDDADIGFGDDRQIVMEQMIVILVHGAG